MIKTSVFENNEWKEKDVECQHLTSLKMVSVDWYLCPLCLTFINEVDLLKSREMGNKHEINI